MIALAFALAVAPATQQAQVRNEVVVLGAKLANWKATVQSKRGRVACITQTSSGDRDVDAIGCTAMTSCIDRSLPTLLASGDKKRPRAERKALNAAAANQIKDCTMARRDALLAALAERRFEARQGNQ